MLAKRIIPCLDIQDGRTVKGIEFINIRDAGDPVELGARYSEEGADELVYLDITASYLRKKVFTGLVKRIAAHLNIPFCVGGGISDLNDAECLLTAGADKICVNTAALKNPDLIGQIASRYGSQFVVLAVDARLEEGLWQVYMNGGRTKTGKELYKWTYEGQERGCGEILFTSMNHDGTKRGFATYALARLSNMLHIPVIASGGAGKMEHFRDVFTIGKADAALAASIFHFSEINIKELKDYLNKNNIPVRNIKDEQYKI